MSFGLLMQLRPDATRDQFKVAFKKLNHPETGRCNQCWQGLPLVHFLAQPEPDLSLIAPYIPQETITSSQQVEECTRPLLSSV